VSTSHLITGGAGFIGSHLADALIARGDDVTLLDDLSTGRLSNVDHLLDLPNVRFVEGSTSDASLVDGLVRDHERTVHLASAVGVQLIVSNPVDALVGNVDGCRNVMQSIARHGRRGLYTSTSEVYGKSTADALGEDADRVLGTPFKSRWNYAIAKGFGEALAHGLHRDHGARIVTARLFNTTGPRQTGRHGMVVPTLVRQALEDRELTVHGDGTQTRCFTHVDDTVAALLALLDSDTADGGVFNVGSSRETSIIELAEMIIARSGSRSPIALVPYDEAYGDGFEELGRRRPDTSRLRALTGWEPVRTLEDAVDDIVAHERVRPPQPAR
jgi:UDP-glucose 4-epimerase